MWMFFDNDALLFYTVAFFYVAHGSRFDRGGAFFDWQHVWLWLCRHETWGLNGAYEPKSTTSVYVCLFLDPRLHWSFDGPPRGAIEAGNARVLRWLKADSNTVVRSSKRYGTSTRNKFDWDHLRGDSEHEYSR